MRLRDRIETEVLDHGDRARVESQDMRCLCETIAICTEELIAELGLLRRELNENLINIETQLENLQNITVFKG